MQLDPGAVIWNTDSSERAGRPLLLLMHGKGSDEHDLAGLVPELPGGWAIASLRALLQDGPGWSWFPPAGRVGAPALEAVDAAVDAVLDWLDTLPPAPLLGTLGFSQGGVMATHLLRRAPQRFAFAVNLAGFTVEGDERGDGLLAGTPVFWGRGDADAVIPPEAIARTAAWLPAHVDLTARTYPGLAHGVSREELDDVRAFLDSFGGEQAAG